VLSSGADNWEDFSSSPVNATAQTLVNSITVEAFPHIAPLLPSPVTFKSPVINASVTVAVPSFLPIKPPRFLAPVKSTLAITRLRVKFPLVPTRPTIPPTNCELEEFSVTFISTSISLITTFAST
jgi:hypothetical protein